MILEELGLERVINATGNITILGGTTLDDEILEAMREAANVYVDVPEAHLRAGALIAKWVGVEAGYVTAGCAAALALSAAACMTKGDLEMMLRLPRTEGMPDEIIIQKLQRTCYDHSLEIAGARLRVVGNDNGTLPRELEDAIGENTAAVLYCVLDPQEGVIPLERVLELSHKHGVPVIVDAAAELPPKDNLSRFVKMGADLVCFSGGKDLGAPNDTGLILGRKDLVDVCRRLGPQNYETVGSETKVFLGRPMKVSKEDIFAVVAAVKKYLRTDHDQRRSQWVTVVDKIVAGLSDCSNVRCRRIAPDSTHLRPLFIPRVEVEFAEQGTSAEEVAQQLRNGKPPVHAYVRKERLYLNPQCLQDGDVEIIVSRLQTILSTMRLY